MKPSENPKVPGMPGWATPNNAAAPVLASFVSDAPVAAPAGITSSASLTNDNLNGATRAEKKATTYFTGLT